jgi:hypothetical protein
MARYSMFTSLTPPEALARAVAHFGAAGSGLRLTQRGLDSVRFEGGGGFVQVEAQRAEDGRTELLIETMQLDDEARRFLAQLPADSLWQSLRRRLRRRR